MKRTRRNFESAHFNAALAKAEIVQDLLRALEECGINRSELARRLGTSRQYVSEIIREESNLSVQSLAELAAAFGWQLIVSIIPPGEAMPAVPLSMLPRIRKDLRRARRPTSSPTPSAGNTDRTHLTLIGASANGQAKSKGASRNQEGKATVARGRSVLVPGRGQAAAASRAGL
jgi:transcriptional regulator with XRE-family HTH domain